MTMRIHGDKIEFPDGTEQFTASSGSGGEAQPPVVMSCKLKEQPVTSNSPFNVAVDTVYADTNNGIKDNKYIVPEDGFYDIKAQLRYTCNENVRFVQSKIVVDSNSFQTSSASLIAEASHWYQDCTVTTVRFLTKGQEVEVQGSSATQPTSLEIHYGSFSISKVTSITEGEVKEKEPVVFRAGLSAEQLGITHSVWAKVKLDTIYTDGEGKKYGEDADLDTVNNRFKPSVAGWYQINAQIQTGSNNGEALCALYKNGKEQSLGIHIHTPKPYSAESNAQRTNVVDIVYLDGDGDYLELWGRLKGDGNKFSASKATTYFSAHLITGQSSGTIDDNTVVEPITFKTGAGSVNATGTETVTIEWDEVEEDSSGAFDSATNSFKPKVAGWYQLNASCGPSGSTYTTAMSQFTTVRPSGTNEINYINYERVNGITNLTNGNYRSGSCLVHLNGIDDHVQIQGSIFGSGSGPSLFRCNDFSAVLVKPDNGTIGVVSGTGGGSSIDYEEGEYDAELTIGDTVNATTKATYSRIGNQVTVHIPAISVAGKTGTGVVKISAPFIANNNYSTGVSRFSGFANLGASTTVAPFMLYDEASIGLQTSNADGYVLNQISDSHCNTNFTIHSTDISYQTSGFSSSGSGGSGGGEVATLPSNRNLIMNGGMRIAQWKSPEWNSALNREDVSVTTSSNGFHTVDRWQYIVTQSGTYKISQEYDGSVAPREPQDVPLNAGVSYTAKMVCTTAKADPIMLGMQQHWEGRFLQHLKWGTPEAEDLTLSFWIKSNKTGVYTANLTRNDADLVVAPKTYPRVVGLEYTINAVDTWEKKTITFSGDTDPIAAFDTNLNYKCLSLGLWFGAGDMYTSGTFTNGTWTNILDSSDSISPNQVNLSETVGNYINITAVQLEKGDKATDFEVIPFSQELLNCQRYCQSITKFNGVSAENKTDLLCSFDFKTEMSKNTPKFIQDGLFSFTDGTNTYTQSREGAYVESSGGVSSEGVTLKLMNFTFPTAGKMCIKKEIDNTQTNPSRLIVNAEL